MAESLAIVRSTCAGIPYPLLSALPAVAAVALSGRMPKVFGRPQSTIAAEKYSRRQHHLLVSPSESKPIFPAYCFQPIRMMASEAVASDAKAAEKPPKPKLEFHPPEEHPLLQDPRCPVHSDLPAVTRVYTFLAAHVLAGDLKAVVNDWSYLPVEYHEDGFEIILQTFLFAGLPRVINALTAIRQLDKMKAVEKEASPWNFVKAGEDLNRNIYGAQYQKLRERVAMLHPDLDHWMIEIAYGRVLARPGPCMMTRELCLVSVLAGMNCGPQLLSHIRGSLHMGANNEMVRRVLDQTGVIFGPEAQSQVDAVWTDFVTKEHKTLDTTHTHAAPAAAPRAAFALA